MAQANTLHLYDYNDNWGRRMGYAEHYCEDYRVTTGQCFKNKPGSLHAAVASIGDVRVWIQAIGRRVRTIHSVRFHTHGAPGYIHLPNGGITAANVATLRPVCTTYVSAPGQVVFFGCNVGEGDRGRAFLEAAGRAMLGHGGGTVHAVDSVTFSVPWLGQRYPIWGDDVTVEIQPGGG